jgi:indole-3-glycerol phosphate synthase
VTPLPVLRKDFIIDEYQIYEARAYGADAILLITEILTPGQMLDMLILAGTMKMTTLIEVHSAESLLQVRKTVGFPHERYSLLGINNRDLHSQTVDVNNTLRLMSLLEEESRGPIVSESGIKTAADIEKLAAAGVSAVLIGETFMRSPEIEELLGPMPGNENT